MPRRKLKPRQPLKASQAFAPVNKELIEVLDANSRPFMVMPREAAINQGLVYQAVLVVIRNRDGKIYIHKRSASKESYPGLWSVSASGFVQAGEALEDAALRELSEELGVTGLQLHFQASLEPTAATDLARVALYLSSPANVIVNPAPEEITEGMFVDEDELEALLRDMPEMLTPALKWAATCDLFIL